jgi:hypothetical protein
MIKTAIIFTGMLIFFTAEACHAQFYWIRTIGDSAHCYTTKDVEPTPDGNILVAGYRGRSGPDTSGMLLMKVTPGGDTLWTKHYGGPHITEARAIAPVPDGNFIIAGNIYSLDSQSVHIYCVRIDSGGDTLWTRTYAGDTSTYAHDVARLSDGNFMVCGEISESSGRSNDICLLKIGPDGEHLTTKSYGDSGMSDIAYAVGVNSAGKVLVCGITESFHDWFNRYYYGFVLPIDSSGDSRVLCYFGTSTLSSVTALKDGNFMVTGSGVWKLTPDGNTIWQLSGLDNQPRGGGPIIPLDDGNFIVFGRKSSSSGFVMKFGPKGRELWEKTFNDIRLYSVTGMAPTTSGDLVVVADGAGNNANYVSILSFINDRYAFFDSLFTFKIPVSGDSLAYTYAPLLVPSGMTVSKGGTISWTPKTHGSYMDYVEICVTAENGRSDTLTFDIIVNDPSMVRVKRSSGYFRSVDNKPFGVVRHSSAAVVFSLPVAGAAVKIYDINGRCVREISSLGRRAIWDCMDGAGGRAGSGRYFAVLKGHEQSMLMFCIVR